MGVRRGGEVEIRRRYLSKVKKEMLLKQINFYFLLLSHYLILIKEKVIHKDTEKEKTIT